MDSWLIWKLTGGAAHVTDYSNASRTMLFNIHDPPMGRGHCCRTLGIPASTCCPRWSTATPWRGGYRTCPDLEGRRASPSAAAPGDQQAALFGQACFTPGQAKNTYGTGCFTADEHGRDAGAAPGTGLLTTVAWSLDGQDHLRPGGQRIRWPAAAIQWLRDELRLIDSARRSATAWRQSVPDTGGVYLVPAFTGLGAPYWDMYARGTIVGLTRGTSRAHIARAVLDAIAFQVTDLVQAMNADAPCPITTLRVDGGASVSDIMMQTQADLLRLPVDRPAQVETTAFGAAALAGLAAGVWRQYWRKLAALRRSQHVFTAPAAARRACEAGSTACGGRAVDRAVADGLKTMCKQIRKFGCVQSGKVRYTEAK